MEYVVRRRYNDFVWLRQKLIDAFPTHVVPVSILQTCLNYIYELSNSVFVEVKFLLPKYLNSFYLNSMQSFL